LNEGDVKILITTVALAVGIGLVPAMAADLPPSTYYPVAPVAVVAQPHFNWSGCYIGIEGGGAWGQSQQTAATSPNPAVIGLPITNGFNPSGAIVGGTVGCNYQVSSVVLGIEDDMSWTNASGNAADIPPFGAGTISTTSEKWLDTLRGRVGFAWDRFLVYGTGGAAFAGENVGVCAAAAICPSDTQTRTGWTAGAGGEWAAWTAPAGALTVKVEYLHADFGTGLFINPPVVVGTTTINSRNVKLTDDIVRAGVNWKFNWW
jgi:outer membrane immunogenic protein